jgi:phosphodiesterase/alkaline phosphatase D-like protein
VSDVVFLTGDIHTGWSSEAYVEQGDAPLGEPVAAEFVCPGISSENFNERLGMLSIGTPFPHGSTNPVGVAAIAANKHVRYVDFDSNGYVLVDVRPDRIITRQRILGLPLLNPPDYNPIEDPDATVNDAPNGAFEVRRGSARLLPAL